MQTKKLIDLMSYRNLLCGTFPCCWARNHGKIIVLILLWDIVFLLVHVSYFKEANTHIQFVPSVCFDTNFLSRRIDLAICKTSWKLGVPSRSCVLPQQGGRSSLSWGRWGGPVQTNWPWQVALFPVLDFQVTLKILAKETEADDSRYEMCVIPMLRMLEGKR